MEVISSIYNSGYNIKKFYLGSRELNLAYLGNQVIYDEVIGDNDLNYILYEFYGSDTLPNTVEAPVKSAILKGQTLVNLFNFNNKKNLGNCKLEFLDNQVVITGGLHASIYIPLKKSTTYTLFAKSRTNGRIIFIQDYTNYNSRWVGTYTNANELTIYKFKTFDVDSNYGIMFYSSNGEGIYEDVMVLEGDYTNVDIPYFEGMQSVKVPVLTTSNGDGTKTNILTVNEDVTLRSNGDVYDELNLLTGRLTQRIDENNEVLAQEVVKTVDLTIVDQDGKTISILNSFNGATHVSTEVAENSAYPMVSLEVASELQAAMSKVTEDIELIKPVQNDIETTIDTQSNDIDSLLLATTELFEIFL